MDREKKARNTDTGSDAACSSSKEGRKTKEEDSRGPNYAKTNIDCLPPEMMKAIFTFLSKKDKASVAQVSKGWRDLVNDPMLWKDERAVLDSQVTDEGLQSMAIRRITHVSIHNKLALAMLQMLLRIVLSLQFLDLSNAKFTCLQLTKAFSVDLPHLKGLSLPKTYSDGIFAHLSNLKVLCLPTKCDMSLTNIVPCLPRLRRLKFKAAHRQRNWIDMSILSRVQLPSLTSLCLLPFDLSNDEQIGYIKAGLPNLHTLCIETRIISVAGVQSLAQISSLKELFWWGLADEEKLTCLFEGSLKLRALAIHTGYKVTASLAQKMARMTSLEEFHSSVMKEGLEQLSQGIPQLKKLVLAFFQDSPDLLMPFVARMSWLECLHIEYASLSEKNLETLQKGLVNLQALHVRKSILLSLKHIAGMPKLQDLSLCSCTLDSIDVEDLKTASSHLRHLNINNCILPQNVTEELRKTLMVTEISLQRVECPCHDWYKVAVRQAQ